MVRKVLIGLTFSMAFAQLPGQRLPSIAFTPERWPTGDVDSQILYYPEFSVVQRDMIEIINAMDDSLGLIRKEFFVDGTLAVFCQIKQVYRVDTMWTISPWTYTDSALILTGFSDLRHGAYQEYWSDGTMKHLGFYIDDRRDGLFTTWDSLGNVYCQRSFDEGRYHGRSSYFHSNGQLKRTGKHRNGNHVGKWKDWDEDGRLIRKAKYRKGKLVKVKEYY